MSILTDIPSMAISDAPLITPPDGEVQAQNQLLTELRASPYFRNFEPRAYPLYDSRHYKPILFLEQVGIEKIGELIHHGLFEDEICCILGVSTRVFRKWISNNQEYTREINESRIFAANAGVGKARRILEDTRTFPDTSRAKAIADHYQWVAERWDKDTYGTKQVKVDATVASTFSYDITINVPQATKDAIEGVARVIEKLPEAETFVELPSLDFTEDDE